jgi:hypothetical protein
MEPLLLSLCILPKPNYQWLKIAFAAYVMAGSQNENLLGISAKI